MTGLKFPIPQDWNATPLLAQHELLSAKFETSKNTDRSIQFGSVDLFESMSAQERLEYPRSILNSSFFTAADIAEMYEVPLSDVKTVKYGENEYHAITKTETRTVLGMDITMTLTQLLLLDNGYMYAFQFNAADDDELYSDFETLLAGVKLP